jgi:hypothetical protein
VTVEVLLPQFLTPLHVSVLIDHHQRDIYTAWKPLLQWVFRLLKLCTYNDQNETNQIHKFILHVFLIKLDY